MKLILALAIAILAANAILFGQDIYRFAVGAEPFGGTGNGNAGE